MVSSVIGYSIYSSECVWFISAIGYSIYSSECVWLVVL